VHAGTGTLRLLFGVQVVVVQALVLSPVAGVQVETPTGPVRMVGQVVAVQLFAPLAGSTVHEPEPVGPVVAGGGQVVAVQTFPPAAATGVHDATGVGPVRTGAGQVVVVQRFAAVGGDAEHESTGTLKLLFVEQSISSQLLPALAVCGVQVKIGAFGVVTFVQVVATQPLPGPAGSGTHVPGCTGVFRTTKLQSVR
jgi:hypothetical protein